MSKARISEIVPRIVSVSQPVISEIHKKLGGKQALPGSPAGSEAKPNPKVGGVPPGIGR